MPHVTLELGLTPAGRPKLIAPAKINQVYPDTALIWDTPVYSGAAPQTPSMFWTNQHIIGNGFAPFCTRIDEPAFAMSSSSGLLEQPEYPERRFRGNGPDRFSQSRNLLKHPSGPIGFPSDQYVQMFGTTFTSANSDGSNNILIPGNARFRHTALGCNVLFADGSVRTLYLRPFRKVASAPIGQGQALYVDSDFRRHMLMIKWPPGFSDSGMFPTN
jgi:prepilin-type processing-associated H-X9-DG protein